MSVPIRRHNHKFLYLRLKRAPVALTLLAMLASAVAVHHAKAQVAAPTLQAVVSTAKDMCARPREYGISAGAGASVNGQLNVPGLIAKLLKAGAAVSLKADGSIYNGVLQKDLASSLADYRHCTEHMSALIMQYFVIKPARIVDQNIPTMKLRMEPASPVRSAYGSVICYGHVEPLDTSITRNSTDLPSHVLIGLYPAGTPNASCDRGGEYYEWMSPGSTRRLPARGCDLVILALNVTRTPKAGYTWDQLYAISDQGGHPKYLVSEWADLEISGHCRVFAP